MSRRRAATWHRTRRCFHQSTSGCRIRRNETPLVATVLPPSHHWAACQGFAYRRVPSPSIPAGTHDSDTPRARRRTSAGPSTWTPPRAWHAPCGRLRQGAPDKIGRDHGPRAAGRLSGATVSGWRGSEMARHIRRVAINTGGGDAPGLNAVIRAAVLGATRRGWQVLGIQRGYEGLLDTSRIIQLDDRAVRGITHLGGTILGTTNKGNPFEWPMRQADGQTVAVDRSDEVVRNIERLGIDALDRHRRRRLDAHRPPPGAEGGAGRRRAQDDRQRPRGDGRHFRLRHRGRPSRPRRSTGCTRRPRPTSGSSPSR